MRKLLSVLIFFSLSVFAHAHDVDGMWVVDVEKTLSFNTENIKMSSLRLSVLECSIKNTSMFFYKGAAKFAIKEHLCEHGNKKARIDGVNNNFKYSVLFENERQLVLKFKSGEEHVQVLNWMAPKLFWFDESAEEEVFRYFYKKA